MLTTYGNKDIFTVPRVFLGVFVGERNMRQLTLRAAVCVFSLSLEHAETPEAPLERFRRVSGRQRPLVSSVTSLAGHAVLAFLLLPCAPIIRALHGTGSQR